MRDVAILNGTVITPDRVIENGCVLIRDGRIAAVEAVQTLPEDFEIIDAGGRYVVPGFIDSHTHGGYGVEFIDASPQELDALLKWLPSTGTTAVLATIVSASQEEQLAAITRLTDTQARVPFGTAIAGIHLEGPYLNPEKRGSQPFRAIRPPDLDEIKRLVQAGGGAIRLMTLAPEVPKALDAIRVLREHGVYVSAGHTLADYDQMLAAVQAGVNRVTHLYNAMPGLEARRPGVIGAALTCDALYAEITLDNVHVHSASAQVALRAKGYERIVLITDAMRAAGVGDGVYVRPGEEAIIVENGVARTEAGQLAGSTLTMDRAVANAVRLLHLPLQAAVAMATRNVAESLGLQHKGALVPGNDADVVLLDANLDVALTLVAGRVVYRATT